MSANVTMVAQSILQLRLGSKYLSLTFALPLCILGVLGSLLNILVFLTLGNYKHNASSLYVLCKSFFDLTALVIGLAFRVLSHGFLIDLSLKSRVWCKIRGGFLDVGVYNSLTCLCLLSIDAFLSSSSSATLRQKSNVRTARYVLIGVFIFWVCHQSPYVIFQELVSDKGKPTCRTTNNIYANYRNYCVVFILTNAIPITVISVFGFLTYRHLRVSKKTDNGSHTRCRSLTLSHLARQMTNMTLFHIVIVSLCQIPFAVAQVYFTATEGMTKTAFRQAQEQLAQMIVVTLNYGIFASSFYCYCAASKRFRQQVLDALIQLRCNPRTRALPSKTTS